MKKLLIVCVIFFFNFHNHFVTVYGVNSYSAGEIWTKINSGDSILLIDSRDREQYLEGHIPTAINIPYSGTVNQSTINLINSYNRSENIAYCSCPDGSSSKAFADSVLEFNLKVVLYMHDDFRYWLYSIVTGNEPGTLSISKYINSSPLSSSISPNIEPFFIINVVLGFLIIVILLRKRGNS
ncbi:MAG: rhodanese-like domain-containing protein [Candidatus Hodarchaeales archaeon]